MTVSDPRTTTSGDWQGRRVLVTGAGGFIGSHLVEGLLARGARVRALCQYNSRGRFGWLDGVTAPAGSVLEPVLGDIRDSKLVEETVEGVQVVFHLAALIGIPYSYHAPQSYVDTNITGTLNVLEAVRRHGTGRLVQTSTSEVYGTPESVPIREDHPLKGQSPYSATKIAADKLCEAYHRSFGVPVTILRPFNTFGPRQSSRAIIPTLLSQVLAGRSVVKLGSLEPRRDFTYVTDTVAGMMCAGSTPGIEGATIQLGTGRAVSIGELADLVRKVTGRNFAVESTLERARPAASEVEHLESDPTRAAERMGWQFRIGLEEGLERTARWIETRLDDYRIDHYQV